MTQDEAAQKLLKDIADSASRLVERFENTTLEEFTDSANLDAQDIAARRLSIIGEAAAALLRKHGSFCAAHPTIPLIHARGMRNILVHEYNGVDWALVWTTIKTEIPGLLAAIKPLIQV